MGMFSSSPKPPKPVPPPAPVRQAGEDTANAARSERRRLSAGYGLEDTVTSIKRKDQNQMGMGTKTLLG